MGRRKEWTEHHLNPSQSWWQWEPCAGTHPCGTSLPCSSSIKAEAKKLLWAETKWVTLPGKCSRLLWSHIRNFCILPGLCCQLCTQAGWLCAMDCTEQKGSPWGHAPCKKALGIKGKSALRNAQCPPAPRAAPSPGYKKHSDGISERGAGRGGLGVCWFGDGGLGGILKWGNVEVLRAGECLGTLW